MPCATDRGSIEGVPGTWIFTGDKLALAAWAAQEDGAAAEIIIESQWLTTRKVDQKMQIKSRTRQSKKIHIRRLHLPTATGSSVEAVFKGLDTSPTPAAPISDGEPEILPGLTGVIGLAAIVTAAAVAGAGVFIGDAVGVKGVACFAAV